MADRNQRGRSVEIAWGVDRKGVRIDDPQRCVSEFYPVTKGPKKTKNI